MSDFWVTVIVFAGSLVLAFDLWNQQRKYGGVFKRECAEVQRLLEAQRSEREARLRMREDDPKKFV